MLMRSVLMVVMAAGCWTRAAPQPPARPASTPKVRQPTTVEVGSYDCTLAIDGAWQRPYRCEVKSFYQDGETHVYIDAIDPGDAYATDAQVLVHDGRPWLFLGAYHEAKALRPDEDEGAGFKADLAYRDGAWIGELDFSHELEFGGMDPPPTHRITLRMTRLAMTR